MKKLLTFLFLFSAITLHAQTTGDGWVGTWAAAAEYTGQGDMPHNSLSNKSVRQVVRLSLGGNRLRLRLSNEFGSDAVRILAVYVAHAKDSCQQDDKTAVQLTFGKRQQVVIPAGETVCSDAFDFHAEPLERLSVTVCYGLQVPEHATSHRGSRTTSYIALGAVSPDDPFEVIETVDHWYNIAAIEVLRNDDGLKGAVAVLGNSITDGRGSTTNAQDRWPDRMSEKLNEGYFGGRWGVLNLGIGGNCVVEGGLSEPALKRFDRDILGQTGLTRLIIFEGTNDIGLSEGKGDVVADKLIAAYQRLIAKAHRAGLRVYGGTITPFKGNGWYSKEHEKARQKVNRWIRGKGHFDAVIDFDLLVRDPKDKEQLRQEYSDDWLHLNPKGYEAMGRLAAEKLK